MKDTNNILKCVVIFFVIGSIILLSVTNAMSTEIQKPYKDVKYDSNIVSDNDWDKTDIGEYPIGIDSK